MNDTERALCKDFSMGTGHYNNEHFPKPFPKLQILTIEGLLSGTERALYPDMSMGGQTFAKTKKEKKGDEKRQLGLL